MLRSLFCVLCSLLLLQLVAAHERYIRSATGERDDTDVAGGYVHPDHNTFLKAARSAGTDKVRPHHYHTLYGKYFQRLGGKRSAHKLLEIGLGCSMRYGPGKSAHLWRNYFPKAEIWQAEINAECVAQHKDTLDALKINVVTGDQADVATLRRWVNETGGGFDYIIDDGGHKQMQQFHSLIVLFVEALKPGGVYFLEDTNVNRAKPFMDGDKKHNMLEIIKDWLELLLNNESDGSRRYRQDPDHAYQPKWPLPMGLKSIECSLNMCAFIKCYADDFQCPLKVMKEYKLNDAGVMSASFDEQ